MITNFNAPPQKSIVIVSHSFDEAITKCVVNSAKNLEADIRIVSLHELMSDYEIFDEISDFGTSIKWTKELIEITNTDYYLLNRVLYVPNNLFSSFTKIDREYAQREFEAYIGFSFNAFNGIGNHLPNGVCVESISLPKQWSKIAKEFEINAPNYYWGPPDYNYLNNKHNVVYSKIYNFLNWSVKSHLTDEDHIFCFEKPLGQPVFIFSIGDKHLITSDIYIPNKLKAKLKALAKGINQYLNHFISEILIFIDEEKLNFGCINPEVIRSNKNKDFENFVCVNLVSEFYKCIS